MSLAPISAAESEHGARLGAQPRGPGEHRIAGRARHLTHAIVEDLGDVERIAASQPVKLGRVEATAAGQPRHCGSGQRRQVDAPDRPLGGQVTQRDAERVRCSQSTSR